MNILLVVTELSSDYLEYVRQVCRFSGLSVFMVRYDDLPRSINQELILAIDLKSSQLASLGVYKKPIIEAFEDPNHEIKKHTSGLKGKFSYQDLKKELSLIARKSPDSSALSRMVGVSTGLVNLKSFIQKVSGSDAAVLILGESGTGKEMVARAIHETSSRSQKPFIALNCAAIPSELLESELFGYERGAFTGANQTKIGRFEMAEGGTLFLDEIGDMPIGMQVKLLRVLQEKTFERVGGQKAIISNARIISATNQNVEQNIKKGLFREDLFYRLNVLPVIVPALRERREDIPYLIDQILNEITHENKPRMQFTQEALSKLENYTWPGNIRELFHLLERLTILHSGELIDQKQLESQLKMLMPSESLVLHGPLKQHLENLERQYIESALKKTGGVVTKAANILGIQRTTLIEKMKKYRIQS